jgi:uncharacterized protein with ATP-grasp and redox domains
MYKKFGENTTYKDFDEAMGELYTAFESIDETIEELKKEMQETKKLFYIADDFARELFNEKRGE